ncbi:MAG: YceI family protein [Ferruginibacter sp.]
MKKTLLSFTLVLATGLLFAQKKTTTSAIINFDATTSIDALPKAENKTVIASLDTKTGKMAFESSVKSFTFSNPRIQEHFNNKGWMDSDQFPSATFIGSIANIKTVNFEKNGVYAVNVNGNLTIHGVTKSIETKGTVTVKDGVITTNSEFSIKLEDYAVSGGAIGAGKVSKEPVITVTAVF